MIGKIKLAIYAIFAYLDIGVEAFLILMAFMCADSAMGAIKAIRLGDTFSFKKMLWGFSLKLCFLIIPLVVALLGKAMGYDFSIAVDIVIKILTVAEAYSIFGNIYSAKNKVEVKKIDVISMLLISLRKMIKNAIDGLFKKLENLTSNKE